MKTWKIPPILHQWKGAIAEYKYVFLVIVVGMIFLMFPSQEAEQHQTTATEIYEITDFEQHLAGNLSQIQGVGKTSVVLTLRNDGQKIYAQNIQKDSEKTTSSTVTIGSGNNAQVVEVQQIYPQFQGALVVCEGGDLPSVQLKLIQAVSALTGLGSDSITICKSDG